MLDANLPTEPVLAQNQNCTLLDNEQNGLISITAQDHNSPLFPYLDRLDSFDSFQQIADDPTLRGNGEQNLLLGSNDNNQLHGLAGDDLLIGDQGNDTLTGGTGKDILVGGDGHDLIVDDYDGGDLMTGEAGDDIFSVGNWGKTENPNLITDFTIGSDREACAERDRLKVGRLGATFDNLTIQNSDEGAIVSDGEHQIAIVQGVKAENLQPDSFIFGDRALADQLQENLDKGQIEGGTPGATQAIVTSDGFTWQGAAGVSNLDTQTPTQADDVFNIASITKSFTAATVLKLTESGELSLDDTLGQWLPDVAANIPDGQNITVRQILNGTSGIPDYRSDSKFIADVQADLVNGSTRKFKSEELVAYIYGQPRFSEGESSSTEWTYPETGNIIAKLIVEKATGMSFEQVLDEEVLQPLGLNTTFVNGTEQVVGNQASGYDDYLQADGSLGRDGVLDDATSFNPSVSGGDLLSNSQDLARFSDALFRGELLQPSSQKELLTFVDEGIDYEGNRYGLGVANFEDSFGNYYGKLGATPGYGSQTFYFPDQGGSTVSTLVNRQEFLGDQLDPQNPSQNSLSPIVAGSLSTLQESSL
jgi:D-alanyl-D-alanine carboxypeptidase